MRSDFSKLLCERERRQGHNSQSHYKRAEERILPHRDYDEWASGGKISIRKHFSGKSRKSKHLNENLAPLIGFLTKSCGRKWNDVFSEISKSCPRDSAVNAHVYQHLFQIVELNPGFDPETGLVLRAQHQGRYYGPKLLGGALFSSGTDRRFYVDAGGILRLAPQRKGLEKKFCKNKEPSRETYEIRVSKDRWAVCMKDGIWFWANLQPLPEPTFLTGEMVHQDGSITSYEIPGPDLFRDCYLFHPNRMAKFHFSEYSFYPSSFSKFSKNDQYRTWLFGKYLKYYGDPVYCHSLVQMNSDDIRRFILRK